MAETIRTTYARLFEVRLLHHYWLDDGTTVFDSSSTAPDDLRRLLRYDVRRVFHVQPSHATEDVVAGLRGVVKTTGLGFFVAVPANATVPLDTEFTFYVAAVSGGYDDYTALSLRPRPFVDVPDPVDEHLVHRYAKDVPELSNLDAAATGTGAGKRLYLSVPYRGGVTKSDPVESLANASGTVRQLLNPQSGLVRLGEADELPVYVHQGDVRPITAPPKAIGVPARGVELASDAPHGLVAVVRLHPRRGEDDSDFDLTTADGGVRPEPPVFEVHFRNRWTYWCYLNPDGSTASEVGPFPLTEVGNPHTARKPPVDALVVERTGDPPTITRLVSEIRT